MKRLLQQTARFSLVGLANTGIGLAVVFAVMYLLHAGPLAANALGYSVGWVVSFLLHRAWTFESDRAFAGGLARYLAVVLVSYLLNLCTVLWATSLQAMNPYAAQVVGMAVYTISAFAGCRWFVFRRASPA